jgi:hypothetical protein
MTTAIDAVRKSLGISHWMLDSVLADLPEDAARRTFPNTRMNPITPTVAHAVYGEDVMINRFVLDREPLLTRDGWLARTGVPDDNHVLSPELLAAPLDLAALREYAAAVFGETDRTLAGLLPGDLGRMVPTPFGNEVPAVDFLAMFPAVHLSSHVGEISALKGALGMTGYPM